ncbi:MAG: VanZ family protein [Opitutaceae bacterium]|nr:VanZ family protein [Opitutaceae bacterium]
MRRRFFSRALLWPFLVGATLIAASHRSHLAAPEISNIDKAAHFAVYGLLATLLGRIGDGWRAALWAVVATSLFGVSDELHQMMVPGRSSSVADWIADTLGALIAVALYRGWTPYRRWLETPLWRRQSRVEVIAASLTATSDDRAG